MRSPVLVHVTVTPAREPEPGAGSLSNLSSLEPGIRSLHFGLPAIVVTSSADADEAVARVIPPRASASAPAPPSNAITREFLERPRASTDVLFTKIPHVLKPINPTGETSVAPGFLPAGPSGANPRRRQLPTTSSPFRPGLPPVPTKRQPSARWRPGPSYASTPDTTFDNLYIAQ